VGPPETRTGGAHSTPPDPLAGFKGSYFYEKGREGGQGSGGEGRVFLYI